MPPRTETSRFGRLICAFALGVGCLIPLSGQTREMSAGALAWPLTLRLQMLRLNEVEWRLRRAAGGNCPQTSSATGLAIDYVGAYQSADRTALRDDLRMTALPQVAAVASGSPAALAGVRPGDQIISIHNAKAGPVSPGTSAPQLLAEDLMDWLARQPSGQPIRVDLQRDDITLRKTITPVPLCAGRAILKTDDAPDAYSDDDNLAITTGMIAFTENDDELALIVGHELAHLILQHPRHGNGHDLRSREDQADILGAALSHCAGYDVVKGAAFWPRYGEQDSSRRSRRDTHASPEQRRRNIVQAAQKLSCPVSVPAPASSAPR